MIISKLRVLNAQSARNRINSGRSSKQRLHLFGKKAREVQTERTRTTAGDARTTARRFPNQDAEDESKTARNQWSQRLASYSDSSTNKEPSCNPSALCGTHINQWCEFALRSGKARWGGARSFGKKQRMIERSIRLSTGAMDTFRSAKLTAQPAEATSPNRADGNPVGEI